MNRRGSRMLWVGALIFGLIVCALIVGAVAVKSVYAYPSDRWTVQNGEQLEILRDYVCFGEGQAGQREVTKVVTLSKNVLSAEVFISGFNTWYTRGGDSHGVRQLRMDAWVEAVGVGTGCPPGTRCINMPDPKNVSLKFMYAMADNDTGNSDDYNDACIGFTVLASTQS